jgi:hypothetical protein
MTPRRGRPPAERWPTWYWACPCGDEPLEGERLTPVGTLVSLREPVCPFCGRVYREEYWSDTVGKPATKIAREHLRFRAVQLALFHGDSNATSEGPQAA